MKRALIFVSLAILAACGGGATTALPTAAPTARATATPTPTPTPVPTPSMIYVASRNTGGPGAVLGFSLKSSGNVAPTLDITGNNTHVSAPSGVAVDAAGNVYVSNDLGNAVYIFSAAENGNVAPAATISGSNTTIQGINGITLDSAGNLWVIDYLSNAVDEFAAGQTGNIAPMRTISGTATQLIQPAGVGVDASGNIYVGGNGLVLVFGATASGNVAPARTITDPNINGGGPRAFCFTPSNSVAVGSESLAAVYVYPSGDSGSTPAAQAITGSTTGLTASTDGVACDGLGNIFASTYPSWTSGSLSEFAPGANGNVAPIWSISGSNTLLEGPMSIALH